MKVPLIKPLKKGETLQLEIELEEEVPPEGLRMGYFKRYFSVAHWFPSICVYDNFGWHKDQYLGTGEFYEEISDFEVNLTLPATFLVFHTGELINPQEVYSQSIISKLEEAKNQIQPLEFSNHQKKFKLMMKSKKPGNLRHKMLEHLLLPVTKIIYGMHQVLMEF